MGAQADKDVFLDGTEPLTFSVQGGSATIGAILITVTGDSTAPVGYRISSDAPFLHGRPGKLRADRDDGDGRRSCISGSLLQGST